MRLRLKKRPVTPESRTVLSGFKTPRNSGFPPDVRPRLFLRATPLPEASGSTARGFARKSRRQSKPRPSALSGQTGQLSHAPTRVATPPFATSGDNIQSLTVGGAASVSGMAGNGGAESGASSQGSSLAERGGAGAFQLAAVSRKADPSDLVALAQEVQKVRCLWACAERPSASPPPHGNPQGAQLVPLIPHRVPPWPPEHVQSAASLGLMSMCRVLLFPPWTPEHVQGCCPPLDS